METEDKHKDQKCAVRWTFRSDPIYDGFCTLCEHASEETINIYYELLMRYSGIKDTVNRKW